MREVKPVYLDFNATTPLDPRVFEEMSSWFLAPSNAGSRTHEHGRRAHEAVENARRQIATVIDKKPEDFIFTSGATEANNIAILGLAGFGKSSGKKHIVSTQIEHKAVLEPLAHLASQGFDVELLPVSADGFVNPEELYSKVREDTLLVSVMHVNNETGIVQPIREIAEVVAESEAFFHTDAAQSFTKVDELRDVQADLISISSHKHFGPQGIGGLYVNRSNRIPLEPICFGGGQERRLRPGTLPVSLIVGFGLSAKLASDEREQRAIVALENRQVLLKHLNAIDWIANGDQARCLPHVINIRLPEVDSEGLLMSLRDELSLSNGSACTSSSYDPSHVLLAMGLTPDEANECIRISWAGNVAEKVFENLAKKVKAMRISI